MTVEVSVIWRRVCLAHCLDRSYTALYEALIACVVSLLCTFSSQHSASRSVSVQSRDPDCDTHLSRISKNSLVSLLSSCQWRGCSSLGFDYLDIGIQNWIFVLLSTKTYVPRWQQPPDSFPYPRIQACTSLLLAGTFAVPANTFLQSHSFFKLNFVIPGSSSALCLVPVSSQQEMTSYFYSDCFQVGCMFRSKLAG